MRHDLLHTTLVFATSFAASSRTLWCGQSNFGHVIVYLEGKERKEENNDSIYKNIKSGITKSQEISQI